MGLFKKVEEVKSGLKILAFGDTGSGKTTFALTFPEIVAIDSEDGMAWYKGKNPNLKYILPTTSAVEVEEALEEVENDLMDEIKTFVIDSETKIYENMQLSGLGIAESRARRKGQIVDDALLSQREWGKIKLSNKKIQSVKIMLASKGVNIISIAQQKDLKEKRGENWITIGYIPDTAKGFEYDYDVILRLFTEKNKSGEEIYKAEILKDRTQIHKKGQIVENPSFKLWESVYNQKSVLKESVIDFKKDISKDETQMVAQEDKIEELKSELKTLISNFSKEQQGKILNKCKEFDIVNPLKCDDIETLEKLVGFAKKLK